MPFSIENFIKAALYLGIVGLIAIAVQLLFRRNIVAGEYSRKLIHILVALWMATWRFSLTHLEVAYLCMILLMGIILIRRMQWFESIFGVDRVTYGDLMFVIGIMATAQIFASPMVYAVAVSTLGLADGAAAVIGNKFGKNKYNVFGSKKSIAGALASFTAAAIIGLFFWMEGSEVDPGWIIAGAHIIAASILISCTEFISFKGLDNISLPLITGLLYSGLA